MSVDQAMHAARASAASEFPGGWPLVQAAAYVGAVGVSGMLSHQTPSFMQPLQDEFGWSRTAISFAG